jgi:hypothetical protein
MSKVIKRSISLSPVIAGWADQLAETKGYGANFSAFIADLIRRSWEQDKNSASIPAQETPSINSLQATDAQAQIVKVVLEEAKKAGFLSNTK